MTTPTRVVVWLVLLPVVSLMAILLGGWRWWGGNETAGVAWVAFGLALGAHARIDAVQDWCRQLLKGEFTIDG
jgi:hypothetical protein